MSSLEKKISPRSLTTSWIELNREALAHNIKLFRHLHQPLHPHLLLGSVLKGNAYGHGLREVLPIIHPLVDAFFLIETADAFLIRKLEEELQLPRKLMIVLGAVNLEQVKSCARQEIDVVLGDLDWQDYGEDLRKEKLQVNLHLHLDTGLSREGILPQQIPHDLHFLEQYADVFHIKGIMSHFANTEDVTEQKYAFYQLKNFKEAREKILQWKELSLSPQLLSHFAASAASLILPDAHFDMMRVGISLYGLWPSNETRISTKLIHPHQQGELSLRPVLSWRCSSQMVKLIPAQTYIGYGCTYRTTHPTRIAILPVGYFDGYPRIASSKAYVLVEGKRCPVVGRIMMNHLIIDVTEVRNENLPVLATLIGQDGDEEISAEMLAQWAQTINYEIVTRIASHLPRIFIDEHQ